MPVDAGVKAVLASWAEGGTMLQQALKHPEGANWAGARAIYLDRLAALFPAPTDVRFEPVDLGGVPGEVATPLDRAVEAGPGRALLFLHGGGYASGGARGYRDIAGRLARRLRAPVFLPDYRLAPEHRFPVPIEDGFTAYRAVLARGHAPGSVAVAGDSAGGAMVITLMRWARSRGVPLPASAVAISPWADLTHSGRSAIERDGLDPLCSIGFLRWLARNFLGDALATDPDASPVFADLRGLAPTLIQVGENEVMLSDAIRLAAGLGESRNRVSLEIWPGMFHVWHHCADRLPEAAEALDNAAAFIEASWRS